MKRGSGLVTMSLLMKYIALHNLRRAALTKRSHTKHCYTNYVSQAQRGMIARSVMTREFKRTEKLSNGHGQRARGEQRSEATPHDGDTQLAIS